MSFNLIDRMRFEFGMPRTVILQLINSAPHRYKVYQIPKNSGKGFRTIAQPAREIKLLQRWVLVNLLEKIDISNFALAYVKGGRGIKENAERHKFGGYMLKLDFSDFFPSIEARDFIFQAKRHKYLDQLDDEELASMEKLLFWCPGAGMGLRLSIGAPTSPVISNILLRDFDGAVGGWCIDNDVVFTRYADDMTFTTKRSEQREHVLDKVSSIVESLRQPSLSLNKNKTLFCSKAGRRMVTGLIITNDGNVSLGHERKRLIRSMLHKRAYGELADLEVKRLQGLLAFAHDVEPEFVKSVFRKYPHLNISSLV